MSWLELVFWFCVFFILFVNAGYPLLMTAASFLVREESRLVDIMPGVSIIIAAYNEADIIKRKLDNTLLVDYPPEKLEIIVASDGSTDNTCEIVRTFKDRVKLYEYDRIGKTGVQNETVKKASGEIIIFSDANAFYKADAIKKLVRHFGDEKVACVSGQLVYDNFEMSPAGCAESTYWNYEKLIKTAESRISSLVGVNGSIYAIRKSDYVKIDNRYISDFLEPLLLVKNGKNVIYEPEAISYETASPNYANELSRKIRILTRSIRALLYMKSLLNPFQYGIFSLQLIAHKLFRYMVPFFLITGIVSLVFMTHDVFYYVLFFMLITFFVVAIIGKFSQNNQKLNPIFNLAYYYIIVNYAVIVAWFNIFKKKEIIIWPTDR